MVDTIEWACVLCDFHIQNDWANRATNWIKFCIELEHSSVENIWVTQKAAAVDNWWLAASSWQCATHVLCLMQSCLAKHQITQVTQPPYSPDLVPCIFWICPKLKSPLRTRDFRPFMRFRKILPGNWRWLGELCEVPRCLLWMGLRYHSPMYNVYYILNLLP